MRRRQCMGLQQFAGHREPAGANPGARLVHCPRRRDTPAHRAGCARRRLCCCARVTPAHRSGDRGPRIARMSSEPNDPSIASSQAAAAEAAPAPDAQGAPGAVVVTRGLLYALIVVAAVALVVSGMLWQRLSNIQEQLARQSQESGTTAVEARALAKQAQELARDTAARQAVLDTRLAEVALQRSQVEELVQSLSR